jgi:hypothetical protein
VSFGGLIRKHPSFGSLVVPGLAAALSGCFRLTSLVVMKAQCDAHAPLRSARRGWETPMAEMGRRVGEFLWNYFQLLRSE